MKAIRFVSLALICALAATMYAQNYKVLNSTNTPIYPSEILTQSRGGNLHSTGRSTANLTAVEYFFTTSGVLTYLHAFDPAYSDYQYFDSPSGGLTLGTNGYFYGVTQYGSPYNCGTIFKMNTAGVVKTLHWFTCGDHGDNPYFPPIQSMAGQFYGTTPEGGVDQPFGTIYRINQDGSGFTILHVFSKLEDASGPLVQATDDWFYGTAGGGTHGAGTIFRISNTGVFQTLYNFDGPHGAGPNGVLVQANDGNFYGTAQGGAYADGEGAYGLGVIYRMTPTHQVTVIHNFTGGSDGAYPRDLIQGSDGYLYGISIPLNTIGGILFRISTTGKFTVLHVFDASKSDVPVALIQHTNGFLYGDTSNYLRGEDCGCRYYGAFYRYDLGLPPFVSYLPSWGSPGLPVDILGEGFTSYSKAYFNGVRAQIITMQPTYMRVVVPQGATTGWITVTTTKGTLKSNKKFVVHS